MRTPFDEPSDPRLTALLRTAVDAPPLRPGFHEELEARLTAAGAARGSARVNGAPVRHRSLTSRRLLAVAAVAAAAAVLVFAVLPAVRGTDTATAADVLAAMTTASGGVQTVRMHMVTESVTWKRENMEVTDRSTDTADVTMSIRGDSLSDLTLTWAWKHGSGSWKTQSMSRTTSYDEGLHEARSIPRAGWPRRSSTIRKPAWQTDPAAIGGFTELYGILSARLHAALAEADPSMPVQETAYLGRPAWRCIFTVHERWGMADEIPIPVAFHWDATVDQATGLLVAFSYTFESKGEGLPWKWSFHVTSLETDPPLEPGWQRPAIPAGKLNIVHEGTRFGTPEQVAEWSSPTLPLIPQWAPAGYRLADLASAGGLTPGPSGARPWSAAGPARVVRRRGDVTVKRIEWTMDGQTVLARYRRGFSSFVVQITPKGLGQTLSGKPDVVLTGGYLKGQPAVFGDDSSDGTQVGISAPELITYSDRSQVVITGDLTRSELVRVANSLKVYGDVNSSTLPGFGP